jgi:hypothetical protein
MAAMNMVSAGGRLCTLQENPHFWSPTIEVRPPDGITLARWWVEQKIR